MRTDSNSQRTILRKIGSLAAFILMLTLLLLLVYLTHASSTYASFPMLISGRPFLRGFQYFAGPIKCWYILVTFFLAIAIPYTALARLLSDRKTRLAYWSFVIPTTALYLYLLLILTLPFSWLIQYINTMGFTPKRMYAVFYGLGAYIIILGFLYWATKIPPNQKTNKNNK